MATTLDDLLALLPDNTTGLIGADDMRAVVTGLWNAGLVTTDHLDARVSALEGDAAGGAGDGPTITGTWQWNPQAGVTPSNGAATSDTGTVDDGTTWLRFAEYDSNGTDLTVALLAATGLYIQQKGNAGNWARATVTAATDVGNYVQLTVDVTDSGIVGGAAWQSAVVVIRT